MSSSHRDRQRKSRSPYPRSGEGASDRGSASWCRSRAREKPVFLKSGASFSRSMCRSPARIAEFGMPVRDAANPDYCDGVERWHDAVAAVWRREIEAYLGLERGGRVALLVWVDGDLPFGEHPGGVARQRQDGAFAGGIRRRYRKGRRRACRRCSRSCKSARRAACASRLRGSNRNVPTTLTS